MGLGAAQIDRMSLWQWRAMLAGWKAAHGGGGEKAPVMSARRYDELLAASGGPAGEKHVRSS